MMKRSVPTDPSPTRYDSPVLWFRNFTAAHKRGGNERPHLKLLRIFQLCIVTCFFQMQMSDAGQPQSPSPCSIPGTSLQVALASIKQAPPTEVAVQPNETAQSTITDPLVAQLSRMTREEFVALRRIPPSVVERLLHGFQAGNILTWSELSLSLGKNQSLLEVLHDAALRQVLVAQGIHDHGVLHALSRPVDTHHLDFAAERNALTHYGQTSVLSIPDLDLERLSRLARSGRFSFLALSGHGTPGNFLVPGGDGNARRASSSEIAAAVGGPTSRIRLALINTCHSSDSGVQSLALIDALAARGIRAIGFSGTVPDSVSVEFVRNFSSLKFLAPHLTVSELVFRSYLKTVYSVEPQERSSQVVTEPLDADSIESLEQEILRLEGAQSPSRGLAPPHSSQVRQSGAERWAQLLVQARLRHPHASPQSLHLDLVYHLRRRFLAGRAIVRLSEPRNEGGLTRRSTRPSLPTLRNQFPFTSVSYDQYSSQDLGFPRVYSGPIEGLHRYRPLPSGVAVARLRQLRGLQSSQLHGLLGAHHFRDHLENGYRVPEMLYAALQNPVTETGVSNIYELERIPIESWNHPGSGEKILVFPNEAMLRNLYQLDDPIVQRIVTLTPREFEDASGAPRAQVTRFFQAIAEGRIATWNDITALQIFNSSTLDRIYQFGALQVTQAVRGRGRQGSLLHLTYSPSDSTPLDTGVEAILTTHQRNASITPARNLHLRAVNLLLQSGQYRYVFLSGHGVRGGLILTDDSGIGITTSSSQIAAQVPPRAVQKPAFFFVNACYGASASAEHPAVIDALASQGVASAGYVGTVSDQVAIAMTEALTRSLYQGTRISLQDQVWDAYLEAFWKLGHLAESARQTSQPSWVRTATIPPTFVAAAPTQSWNFEESVTNTLSALGDGNPHLTTDQVRQLLAIYLRSRFLSGNTEVRFAPGHR